MKPMEMGSAHSRLNDYADYVLPGLEAAGLEVREVSLGLDGNGGGLWPAFPSRWQVAVHEAAHAVYARARARVVVRVSVEGIVAIENGTEIEDVSMLGVCSCSGEELPDVLQRCVLSLVGPEAMYRAGYPKPLLTYGEFVRVAEGCSPDSDEGSVLCELRQADEPEGLYEAARAEAEAFVAEHWTDIVTLAGRLMETESLDEEAVELVFDPTWSEFQEMLDELRDDRCPWVLLEGGDEEEGDE